MIFPFLPLLDCPTQRFPSVVILIGAVPLSSGVEVMAVY
jgi:hypothetical protein